MDKQSLCSPLWLAQKLQPWQQKIVAGNSAFNQKSWAQAINNYLDAYHIAQQLMRDSLAMSDVEKRNQALSECCPAFVVSAHNLSDTYPRLGQVEHAFAILSEAHVAMMHLRQHDDGVLMQLGAFHSNKTYQQLIHFSKLYGPNEERIQHFHAALNDPISPEKTLH